MLYVDPDYGVRVMRSSSVWVRKMIEVFDDGEHYASAVSRYRPSKPLTEAELDQYVKTGQIPD